MIPNFVNDCWIIGIITAFGFGVMLGAAIERYIVVRQLKNKGVLNEKGNLSTTYKE